MLRFRIDREDLSPGWWSELGCWWRGSSHVVPFDHPALRQESRAEDSGLELRVMERRPDGDRLSLRIDSERGVVVIEAGPGGVAPVYLATDGDGLVGSWDMAELASFASIDCVSPVVLARLLTRRHRYSHQTAFTSIQCLTAGSTAVWTPSEGLRITYPDPVAHPVVRDLRPGADPVARFAAILDHVTAQAVALEAPVAVELSGGLDSANVAASAVSATAGGPGLVSAGLTVGGPEGVAQRARRDLIARRLGMHDVAVPVAAHLPFAPSGRRSVRHAHQPDGDVYREAFDVLRRALAEQGARTVLTGFGGDELLGPTLTERAAAARADGPDPEAGPAVVPDWVGPAVREVLDRIDAGCSPVTQVPLPTLVVFAARHPRYLDAGLWPVAPLVHPRVSAFGRSLPAPWRTGKFLLRTRLERAGFGPSVTRPLLRETFGPTMDLALQRHAPALLADLLAHSPLIEHGFLAREPLQRLHHRARERDTLPLSTYDLLATDLGIRSMCSATSTVACSGVVAS